MELYIALTLPRHRWVGPADTFPDKWYEDDELTLELRPFGGFLIERARFRCERLLQSNARGGIAIGQYFPTVTLAERCLQAIDHSLEINQRWTRYARVFPEPRVAQVHPLRDPS